MWKLHCDIDRAHDAARWSEMLSIEHKQVQLGSQLEQESRKFVEEHRKFVVGNGGLQRPRRVVE